MTAARPSLPIHIAVLVRTGEPYSMRIYREQVIRNIPAPGAHAHLFGEHDPLPASCELIWDPSLGGYSPPYQRLADAGKPVIATVHGAGAMVLPWRDVFPSLRTALVGAYRSRVARRAWHLFGPKVSSVITVSAFAKQEICGTLPIDETGVHVIHHGVDKTVFRPEKAKGHAPAPYFLTVSQYRRKKNIDRMFAAYCTLPEEDRPGFVAVIPGYRGTAAIRGLRIVREELSHEQLAPLYQQALSFVFPSLHETFGMPIVEAMACGCPVITSDRTACPETSGEAALLVDPTSVPAIAGALRAVMSDESMRTSLAAKGLRRADEFSWQKSAAAHLQIFRAALEHHDA